MPAPDARLSGTAGAHRPAARVRDHEHGRRSDETGARAGRRACPGHVARAAARHPLGCQGPARHRRRQDDLGRSAVSRPRARWHGARRGPARRGRRDSRREAQPWRARVQRHVVRRTHAQPVRPEPGVERLERRVGRGVRSRARWLHDRIRDVRLDRLPVHALRLDRAATHVRARRTRWRDAAVLVTRQAGPDRAHRRGLHARPERDQRPGRRRPRLGRHAARLRRPRGRQRPARRVSPRVVRRAGRPPRPRGARSARGHGRRAGRDRDPGPAVGRAAEHPPRRSRLGLRDAHAQRARRRADLGRPKPRGRTRSGRRGSSRRSSTSRPTDFVWKQCSSWMSRCRTSTS